MYRDHTQAAELRRRELLSGRWREEVSEVIQQVYAARLARVAGGAVALAGFAALLVGTAAAALRFRPAWAWFHTYTRESALAAILISAWAAAAVAYAVARLAGPWLLRRRVAREAAPRGDIFDDVARLELGPDGHAARHAARLERGALALPLVAVALLGPLSLHLVVATATAGVRLAAFGNWIAVSLLLVGHAHAALAVCAARHAALIQKELDRGAPVEGLSRGLWAVLWASAAAALPGAALLFVPPLLVAVTGLVLVPFTFGWAARAAVIERALISAHT